ncbi:MAG TPA: hypothetical protein VHL56_03180 [Candidatus Limnocylindrales bacterium]|jgi:hypothetical protein|nr:hypothetical protein [Candidatus Limnocylindrales bacterium]
MTEISRARVVGFLAITLAIVIGVLLVAYVASPPHPDPEATPIPTPAESVQAPPLLG